MNKQYFSHMLDDDFQSDSFIRSSVTKSYNEETKNFKKQQKRATLARSKQRDNKRNWEY